ncbi:hypothetical protein LOZ61_005329 [Ophidiomyces ophidiicola]|nr:hypothetical protein LOZ61_005329 [Ophidiomyces ophidiicola]KAI1923904.1 hypothetical protein LOZ60_004975 [Ophidiomyces ophidiicola]KAI2141562.1 hypothetical protein LOZ27_004504 [Ophidiomyces ophidiicola]KAI2158544.1 hypothetical protein LOZ25_003370 [Ophidiomyces ophidiicola]KAI2414291.1 hypothetical protein LOY90_001485 [Ophidiomyces ophidiicola]
MPKPQNTLITLGIARDGGVLEKGIGKEDLNVLMPGLFCSPVCLPSFRGPNNSVGYGTFDEAPLWQSRNATRQDSKTRLRIALETNLELSVKRILATQKLSMASYNGRDGRGRTQQISRFSSSTDEGSRPGDRGTIQVMFDPSHPLNVGVLGPTTTAPQYAGQGQYQRGRVAPITTPTSTTFQPSEYGSSGTRNDAAGRGGGEDWSRWFANNRPNRSSSVYSQDNGENRSQLRANNLQNRPSSTHDRNNGEDWSQWLANNCPNRPSSTYSQEHRENWSQLRPNNNPYPSSSIYSQDNGERHLSPPRGRRSHTLDRGQRELHLALTDARLTGLLSAAQFRDIAATSEQSLAEA